MVGGLNVTGHGEEKSPEAQRKAEQRARDEAAGIKEVEVRMGPAEAAMLQEGRAARGGMSGPYTVTEYLLTLLRRDHALLKQEQGVLADRMCGQCRKPLPRGCGGFWAGEMSVCELAKADKALQL